MDQRSLSVSVSAGSLTLCFLVFCLCLSFSLLSICVKERRKLEKRGAYSTTMCGEPQYVASLYNLYYIFFFPLYM